MSVLLPQSFSDIPREVGSMWEWIMFNAFSVKESVPSYRNQMRSQQVACWGNFRIPGLAPQKWRRTAVFGEGFQLASKKSRHLHKGRLCSATWSQGVPVDRLTELECLRRCRNSTGPLWWRKGWGQTMCYYGNQTMLICGLPAASGCYEINCTL